MEGWVKTALGHELDFAAVVSLLFWLLLFFEGNLAGARQ